MRLSARNTLKGRVSEVRHGVVNSEVTLELPGGTQVTAIITKQSAEELGLQQGKEAYAIIKATNVMVAVD